MLSCSSGFFEKRIPLDVFHVCVVVFLFLLNLRKHFSWLECLHQLFVFFIFAHQADVVPMLKARSGLGSFAKCKVSPVALTNVVRLCKLGEVQRRVSIWFLKDLTQDPAFSCLPSTHVHKHAHLYSASLFCRQQECYRLTQRKSACGPLLTQGPSSLWSGQCPTVSLAAGGTQRRKRLSDFCVFIWILFYYYPLFCSFSSFPCLSCSFCSFTLQVHLQHIHGFFNTSLHCVFIVLGTLFPGFRKSFLLRAL